MLAVFTFSGCRRATGPSLAGGKPPSHWVQDLSSPDKRVRKEAATKLGNLGAAEPLVLPALATALHDADAQVRGEAVLALVKLGPTARTATPDLEALARRDPDATVRDYAARALAKLR